MKLIDRVYHRFTVLWVTAADGGGESESGDEGQPQESPAFDASNADRGDLPKASAEPTWEQVIGSIHTCFAT